MTARSSLPLIDVHTHVGTDLLFYFQGNLPYAFENRRMMPEISRSEGLARRAFAPLLHWLKVGDTLASAIKNVGSLTNPAIEEP
jgi:hypothetical protein